MFLYKKRVPDTSIVPRSGYFHDSHRYDYHRIALFSYGNSILKSELSKAVSTTKNLSPMHLLEESEPTNEVKSTTHPNPPITKTTLNFSGSDLRNILLRLLT